MARTKWAKVANGGEDVIANPPAGERTEERLVTALLVVERDVHSFSAIRNKAWKRLGCDRDVVVAVSDTRELAAIRRPVMSNKIAFEHKRFAFITNENYVDSSNALHERRPGMGVGRRAEV